MSLLEAEVNRALFVQDVIPTSLRKENNMQRAAYDATAGAAAPQRRFDALADRFVDTLTALQGDRNTLFALAERLCGIPPRKEEVQISTSPGNLAPAQPTFEGRIESMIKELAEVERDIHHVLSHLETKI